MSVENASAADETIVDEAITTPTGSATSADATPADDAAEFDAAELEHAFGLPQGSLKDATDAESALSIIKEHTDKTLIAGLGFAGAAADAPADPTPAPAKGAAKGAAPAASKAAEAGQAAASESIEELRERIAKLEGALTATAQASKAQQLAELDRRMQTEIDSWKSPKYGTGKARNYAQTRAMKNLRELVATQVAGLQATNQPLPVIEKVLQQVRVFDDAESLADLAKQLKGKKPADAVGAPGKTGKSGKPDGAPKNIHEAFMQSKV